MILDYIILVKSDWEKEERSFLTNLSLQRGNNDNDDFITDIGSNIGLYTILFAKRYPHYKIISIEASKKIFKQLEQNCNLNNIDTSRFILINKTTTDIVGKKLIFMKWKVCLQY
jgi:precorrin-6B methylase 2